MLVPGMIWFQFDFLEWGNFLRHQLSQGQLEGRLYWQYGQQLHFCLKKRTFCRIDFQVSIVKPLESWSVFLWGPRRNDATVQVWYTWIPCETNQNMFHQIPESIVAARETHWHAKPFKGTEKSSGSGEVLTGCVHWDLIKTCRHVDCRKKELIFNVSKIHSIDGVARLNLIVCLLSWR